jgi:large subunit ribosomal protein L4
MTKVNLYNNKGIKNDSISLPKDLDTKVNPILVAQSVRVYEDGTHLGTSYAKTRAEVNATGKKVWKQKGTGNARHGSRRAPIFVGGGKAHGPKGIKRILSIPTKMRQLALKGAFNLKSQTKGLVFVDGISSLGRTKEAYQMIQSILKIELPDKKSKKVFMVLSEKNSSLRKIFQNIKNLKISFYRSLNAREVLTNGFVLVDNSIFDIVKTTEKVNAPKKTLSKSPKAAVKKNKVATQKSK